MKRYVQERHILCFFHLPRKRHPNQTKMFHFDNLDGNEISYYLLVLGKFNINFFMTWYSVYSEKRNFQTNLNMIFSFVTFVFKFGCINPSSFRILYCPKCWSPIFEFDVTDLSGRWIAYMPPLLFYQVRYRNLF